MMASRGMGAVNPKKLPKKGNNLPKKGKRKDGCSFDMYAEGGKVWDTPNPKKKSKALSAKRKASAKAMAEKAGRPYPNLVDNMRASRSK